MEAAPRGLGMQAPPLATPSRIFLQHGLDPPKRDEFEEKHERCYNWVLGMVTDKSEKESNDALAAAAAKPDPKAHEEVCIGLIVGVLAEPDKAHRYYRDLTLISRDGMKTACTHLTQLVLDKYPKMYPQTKQQLLWLTREMIKNSIEGTDGVCWNLLRQIAGGDVSRPNLWLADHLLDIFIDHRPWLEKNPFLLASVVYTYIRILEDHFQHEKLREKEVKFIVSIMRDRFMDVIVIGRDLLRVLQYVAKIPEFEQLWLDIIYRPQTLSTSFSGISQLMCTRTSRRFLQSRITPEMEKKLVFLASQVRFGTHKRYQDWFQRQYLSTMESQSLRCDLIRFIVGVIHPSNELLSSDIIPRWAIIGWLLTTCTNQVASANAKLALFYDWLYFNPDKDNIMNIEPAILVMHHSMKPHPAITATLLDFLCRIIPHFFPKEKEKVHQGITNSLKTILDKGVLPSLLPLFDNAKLDEELRTMLRERFPYFVVREGEGMPPPMLEDETAGHVDIGVTGAARFSDEEDEEEEKKLTIEENKKTKKKPQAKANRGKRDNDGQGNGEQLDQDVKDTLMELKGESDMGKKCEITDNLIRRAMEDEFDFEQCSALASQLADVLQEEFVGKIFPDTGISEPPDDSIEDSIGRPIFVVFRSLCEMTDNDGGRSTLLTLLSELYTLQPRVGYYLLYFLSVEGKSSGTRRTSKEKAAIYKDLCEAIDVNFSLDICLVNDMRQCQEDDVSLFVYLTPEIFTNFPKHSVGNTDLLYLVVSCVDGIQVQKLICHVVSKDFVLFKKDSFQSVLQCSLGWETFEQFVLWQLASAHDLPIECMVPILPKLSYSKNSEALSFMLLLIRDERPTAEMVKSILTREVEPGDRFLTAVVTYWMQDYDDRVTDLVANYLSKQASLGSGGRKRNAPNKVVGNGSLPHPAELCLAHLDRLRQTCKQYDFFNQQSIQTALQQVRNSCTEAQKKKFMDLFALADDSDSEDSGAPSKKKNKTSNTSTAASGKESKSPGKSKKNNNAKSGGTIVISDSSEEFSDDSDENDTRPTKKHGQRGGRGGGSGAKNQRKRKVASYKDVSSDDSSDDEVKGKPKKKKKLATHSDSE